MASNIGNKETMAKNIKYYMDRTGLAAIDICNALGVPQSTFSYWIHARSYPRIDKIEMMSKLFGCSKSDLVEEKNSSPSKKDELINSIASEIVNLSEEQQKEVMSYISFLRSKG